MSKPGRKTKRKLLTSSPPNRKAKGGKSSEADCLICEEPILEADDHCTGDEAVFCEGDCQGWLHRKCAGISRPAFDKLGESDNVYMCSYCTSVSQSNEISQLSTIINNLNTAVTSLTETIKSLQNSISIQPSSSNNVSQVDDNLPHPPDGTNNRLISQPQGTPRPPQMTPDRKFNVVIYGIQESPSNTPKEI